MDRNIIKETKLSLEGAVGDGTLHRECRPHARTIPGDVQEQLLRRRVARSMDGVNPAGVLRGSPQSRSAGDARLARAESPVVPA